MQHQESYQARRSALAARRNHCRGGIYVVPHDHRVGTSLIAEQFLNFVIPSKIGKRER